jgi:hypothetical protein
MVTIHNVEARLSKDQLLEALQQLDGPEFEQLFAELLRIHAQHRAPGRLHTEAELLLKINKGIPDDLRERYYALIEKRRAGTLTPDEHKTLLQLTDEVEKLDAERVKYLVELAQLRQVPLRDLMKSLGIKRPDYE